MKIATSLTLGLLMLITLVIFGCTESTFVEVSNVKPFPNSVGSYWVYEAVEYNRGSIDTFTVTVTITDTLTLPGMEQPASLWVTDPARGYPVYDTTWVMVDNYAEAKDTVRYYFWPGYEPLPWLIDGLVMPLATSDEWSIKPTISLMPATTKVVQKIDVTIPAGNFEQTYELEQLYNCGDECGATYTFWFAEGIGIVKSHRELWDHYDYPDAPEFIIELSLIDYHIAQ